MKRLLMVLLSCMLILTLCSCGKEDIQLSGAAKTIEILLNDRDVLQISVPIELQLLKQDNNHYFEFSNDVGIYRFTSVTTSAKFDEQTGLYISKGSVIRNFDDCSVVINCTGNARDFFIQTLATAPVVQKDVNTYVEMAMEYLPTYETMGDMQLSGDMFMPPGCEESFYDIYSSQLLTNGTDWLQCQIVDAKIADLKPRLMSMALVNSGDEKITGWYESNDIFYCYSSKCIVGAKKLAFNSWYVYQGATSMKDYVLTGIHKVHNKSEDKNY